MSAKTYLTEIHSKLGYFATWLPNTRLEPGDVGLQTPTGFRKETTLRRLGLSVRRSKASALGDLSHERVSVTAAALGLTAGEAGIKLGFGAEGGFVFQAIGCSQQSLEDLDRINIELADLARQKLWQPDWVLVDTVVTAQRAAVLVSEGQGAELSIAGPTDLQSLARASAQVRSQQGSVQRFLGAEDLTLLYRARRIRKRWFGMLPDQVEIMRSVDDALPPVEWAPIGPLGEAEDEA